MDFIYEIQAAVKRAASKLIPRDANGAFVEQGLRVSGAPNACKFEDINFQVGTLREITETLNEWGKSDKFRYKKFPIVCLITPYSTTKPAAAELENVRFTLFIACATEATDRRLDRQAKTFTPILQPISNAVTKEIIAAPCCMTYEGDVRFQEIEHDYWAKEQDANVFNEYVDAIELRDFTINIQQPYCI